MLLWTIGCVVLGVVLLAQAVLAERELRELDEMIEQLGQRSDDGRDA